MIMERSLDGRRALVTGASRGIGRAIAEELGRSGAAVALVARSRADLDQAADAVRRSGATAVAFTADLATDDPAVVGARAADELGGIDIVINNAAVLQPLGRSGPEIDPVVWRQSLEINVTAPAMITFALLPQLLASGWGRIVNISSGVAANPAAMINANAYATGKAAIEGHTLNLAAELEGTGVTANVYRPGTVDTEMQQTLRTQDPDKTGAFLPDRFRRLYERGGLITPEHSARSLVQRIADAGNGQILSVADALPQ